MPDFHSLDLVVICSLVLIVDEEQRYRELGRRFVEDGSEPECVLVWNLHSIALCRMERVGRCCTDCRIVQKDLGGGVVVLLLLQGES